MKTLTVIATAAFAVSVAFGLAVASQDDLGYQQAQQGMSATPDEQLEEVQEELVILGYDPGNIEGEMDDQTREAIREFQQSQGMAATGDIDSQTLQALGLSPEGEQPDTYYGISPEFDEPQERPSEEAPAEEDLSDKVEREFE